MKRGRGRGPRIMYLPGDSWLHHIHPLVKLVWLVATTIFVFAAKGPFVGIGVLALVLLAFPLSHLPLRQIHGAKFFAISATGLFVIQAAFIRTGPVLFELGPLHVTAGGVAAGLYVAGRLLSVVWLGYLFVLTTEPNALAYGLMRAGLPYRYGFALVTALRLVPVFEQEGQTVYQAQLARGIAYDHGGPRRFITLAQQFFMPLLVSALGKVDALAVSMEGRCFGKYPRRTFLNQAPFTRRDIVALAVLVVLVSVACVAHVYL